MLCHTLPYVVNCLILDISVEWKLHGRQKLFLPVYSPSSSTCLDTERFVNDWVEGIGLQQGVDRKNFNSTASFSLESFSSASKFTMFTERICIIICFPARMEFRIRMLRCKRKEQNPTWKEMPNREYSPEWLHIFTVSSNLSVQPLRLISMSLIFLPSNRDHSNSFAFRLPIALCITSHFFVKCCIGPL